jgi:hypothetical protein
MKQPPFLPQLRHVFQTSLFNTWARRPGMCRLHPGRGRPRKQQHVPKKRKTMWVEHSMFVVSIIRLLLFCSLHVPSDQVRAHDTVAICICSKLAMYGTLGCATMWLYILYIVIYSMVKLLLFKRWEKSNEWFALELCLSMTPVWAQTLAVHKINTGLAQYVWGRVCVISR